MSDTILVILAMIKMFKLFFFGGVLVVSSALLVQLISYQIFNINLYKKMMKRLELM